jgi:hypothetical protein
MPRTEEFDRTEEQLRQELDRLWAAYRQAPPEEKTDLRERYLQALQRFAHYVMRP